MSFSRRIWIIIAAIVVVAAGVTVVVINSSSTKSAVTGDTVTFAESPGANPNYIFPYMGGQYFSVDNINQFQQLMFRPLYWFGLGGLRGPL